MVIGYSVTSQWDYGELVACKLFAHLLMSATICMCLSILAMNFDRLIAVSNPDLYATRINSVKTAFLIILVWLVAILFPLPLSLGVIPTSPHPARYVCTISALSSLQFLVPMYTICFGFPAVLNILIFIYVTKEAMSEKEAESRGSVNRPNSTIRLWPEVQTAGVVFILFLIWAISELPYIILSSIEQYITSAEVDQEFNYSPDLDTTFMWLKFCNTFALPLVIFKWRKDIWQKFKDLIFCRKSNSVVDASPRPEKHPTSKQKPKTQVSINQASSTPKFQASFPIPTIKASKDGLHVHGNIDDDDEDCGIFYANLDITGQLDQLHNPALEDGSCAQDVDMGDTSDYETDPYSQSDPISVNHHSRTNSAAAAGKELRSKANSISVLSQDSGNGSASNSVKKKRHKKRAIADINIENDRIVAASNLSINQSLSTSNAELDLPPTSPGNIISETKSNSNNNTELIDNAEVIQTLDSDISKPTKHKKKKKKKNKNIIDAETNTTQRLGMELTERKKPPPRLSPIDPGVIQKSMGRMATPPLRGKVPHNNDLSILPPTGLSEDRRRKTHSAEDAAEHVPSAESDASKSTNRKKKSSRPRNQSGDSEKPLMGSNASSELHSLAAETYQDSYIWLVWYDYTCVDILSIQ